MTTHEDDLKPMAAMTAYELIDLLNVDYPHRCIQQHESEITAHRYSAVRELIDDLLMARENEREEGVA